VRTERISVRSGVGAHHRVSRRAHPSCTATDRFRTVRQPSGGRRVPLTPEAARPVHDHAYLVRRLLDSNWEELAFARLSSVLPLDVFLIVLD
jgi:hypothetical protein